MATITKNTPWRHAGVVPYDIWRKRITDAGGLSRAAERVVWAACGDDSALMLEFLHAESSYASDFKAIPASKNNPWNLQIAGVGLSFPTIAEAALAWRNRLYDPNYKQGIYTRTQTIYDLISVYAPRSDGNDPEGYTAKVVAGMNRNGFDPPVTTPSTPPEPVPPVEGEPMADLVYGRVPKADARDRQIPDSQNMAWDDLGQRTADAVHWHRMVGTLSGTDSYFRTFANARITKVGALTDYGVGTAGIDGSSLDGVAYQWNDPLGRRSGWASGPYNYYGDAYGDGVKLKERFNNVSACNKNSVSIEISGNFDSALSQKAKQTIAAITAYWADQKKIPWDQFPVVPGENRSFVIWHEETCGPTYKTCPGTTVKAATDEMIAMVAAILKQYQTGATAPNPEPVVYAEPQPVGAGNKVINERFFIEHTVEYTLTKDVIPRQYADPTSPATGPTLKKGSKIKTLHVVSDVGASADLTFEIDTVKADGYTIKPGSRVSAEVVL